MATAIGLETAEGLEDLGPYKHDPARVDVTPLVTVRIARDANTADDTVRGKDPAPGRSGH